MGAALSSRVLPEWWKGADPACTSAEHDHRIVIIGRGVVGRWAAMFASMLPHARVALLEETTAPLDVQVPQVHIAHTFYSDARTCTWARESRASWQILRLFSKVPLSTPAPSFLFGPLSAVRTMCCPPCEVLDAEDSAPPPEAGDGRLIDRDSVLLHAPLCMQALGEILHEQGGVKVIKSVEVEQVDRETRQVHCSNGKAYAYDTLVLACGPSIRGMCDRADLAQPDLLMKQRQDAISLKPDSMPRVIAWARHDEGRDISALCEHARAPPRLEVRVHPDDARVYYGIALERYEFLLAPSIGELLARLICGEEES